MPNSIVIFGASGDLTTRKLVPALYLLFKKGRLPENTRVLGASRTKHSHESWRSHLAESTARFVGGDFDANAWNRFAGSLFYQPTDISSDDDFNRIRQTLDQFEATDGSTRVYYLSTMPQLYAQAAAQLGKAGLADETAGKRRIVVEKPFGTDLASAQALNASIHKYFGERQVYRIDHYLGKETVQNMLVLRFANSIFEPIWNRKYIDHVQITVAEEVTVGSRGGYYDSSGVLRDMFQNHLLQLLMIVAMEAPARFDADFVRDEKVKVLRALRPLTGSDVSTDTLRAQYDGYRTEHGVPADSTTATFAALKLHVDNWRWSDVPFYLRSGKAMSCRTTQIVIQFHAPPQMLFNARSHHRVEANRLVIQIQPAEGVQLQIQSKVPDAGMQLRLMDLDFRFRREYSGSLPDAYQRLLLDALNGDASLFARSDEVELAWQFIDPIHAAWQTPGAPPLERYPPGGWGPERAQSWMHDDGRQWFDVCPVLH